MESTFHALTKKKRKEPFLTKLFIVFSYGISYNHSMNIPLKLPLVTTIKERCRVCYTCVRECPAKAIRIADGQADVITARCIGCGNCVQVCGQHAKHVYDSKVHVRSLLEEELPTAAILAPSFPAAFPDWEPEQVAGVFRAMGFDYVCEVAFGADLVADRYRRLLEAPGDQRYIATTCPAIVAYVERFYPDLSAALAPIVSPMVAQARVVRHLYGNDVRVVFVGPCIAKKEEAVAAEQSSETDAALTFEEALCLARDMKLDHTAVTPSEFDPPRPGLGALFPLSRGLIQSARLAEDLTSDDIITTDGRHGFIEAVKEFQAGHCKPRLLEILACQGCIMGPGMPNDEPLFRRRRRISKYVRAHMADLDLEAWQREINRFADIDLTQTFSPDDQRVDDPSEEELRGILAQLGKNSVEDELNCGACGYESCREHAIAIHKGLAEDEMCLPFIIDKLRETVDSLAQSKEKLAQTQETLMQTEKIASMGQLAAGIAHELNNPLGVILMYAHLLLEDYNIEDKDVREDLGMITQQADRCKTIVGGLLSFARQHKTALILVDVRRFVEDTLKLMVIPDSVKVETCFEGSSFYAQMDRDQITQVLTNLIANACHAMPDGGVLTIGTRGDEEQIRFYVKDTGVGIPEKNRKRIFEPFFTTKDVGKGTGMGLAVSYGIIKMHRGNMFVESNCDPDKGPTGSTFTFILPKKTGTPVGQEEAVPVQAPGV